SCPQQIVLALFEEVAMADAPVQAGSTRSESRHAHSSAEAEPTLDRPRLRPLEFRWIGEGGYQRLFIRDPMGVAPSSATVHSAVAILMSFFDGSRSHDGIARAFQLRTGVPISAMEIRTLVEQLDEALFLDSHHFRDVQRAQIAEYRSAAFRV